MKYLLLLIVLIFGVWLVTTRSRADAEPRKRDAKAPPPPAPQAMLECAHCGLHLPAADAVLDGSRVFCSEAHRRLGPRTSGR